MSDDALRVGDERLDRVEELLRVEFAGVVRGETVAAVVRESAARFADAKIMDFVPILAERESRKRLRAGPAVRDPGRSSDDQGLSEAFGRSEEEDDGEDRPFDPPDLGVVETDEDDDG